MTLKPKTDVFTRLTLINTFPQFDKLKSCIIPEKV